MFPTNIPPAKTDGSDWHDSPIRDCRVDCPTCGYTAGPLQPHRTNPAGGWDRIDTWSGTAFVIWVPPPAMSLAERIRSLS
jgi:hypothetical protein